MPSRAASRVTVVVLDDGNENSSQEWTHDRRKRGNQPPRTDYLVGTSCSGANIDCRAIGQQLGFAPEKSRGL